MCGTKATFSSISARQGRSHPLYGGIFILSIKGYNYSELETYDTITRITTYIYWTRKNEEDFKN